MLAVQKHAHSALPIVCLCTNQSNCRVARIIKSATQAHKTAQFEGKCVDGVLKLQVDSQLILWYVVSDKGVRDLQ